MINGQPQTFVFFGIVGSGKGTQVKLLMDFLKKRDDRECVYIGTGDIFRKIVKSSEDNPETKIVKDLLNSGKLVSDEMTNKLVADAVGPDLSSDKQIIFDGYPRTVFQSERFANLMKQSGREDIKIIYIE